jgi:D-alanyl-D-alanine carboxypeptidase (penicillin-binding protein 5/6)
MRYLLGLLLLCQTVLAAAQPDPFPEVAAAYLVEINGVPVWEKQTNRRLPPASLTKLMTALLVVEHEQPQAIAVVSRAAARESGTRLGLKAGEKFHVEDLLAAALIGSANDACHALADYLAGSQMRFVQLMNRRAGELGMRDTRFVNACGHDAVGHYSSVHDLALLANELIKHPAVTRMTAKTGARIATLDGERSYPFESRNALIGRYPGAIGLKTGYTPQAGKCLVAYARRGSTQVLLVMLHGNDRWWDAVDILDLAFDHARPPA